MAKNPTVGRVTVYPASGGLETIAIPGTQTIGRLVRGSNFMVDINGAKKKHPGAIRIDKSGIPITGNTRGLWDFWRTNGAIKSQRTVCISSGKILADNGNGIFQDVTGAFIINPLDNVSIDSFFGLMVMAFTNNPLGKPLKFDQTTVASLGGTPPNARYLRTWENRLWAAGNPSAPDRLYASNIDDPEDWVVVNGAKQINIDQGDQDPVGITSLFPPLFGRMVIGKKRSLYEITPVNTTFAVRNVIVGLGSVSHNAVTAADNDIYFVSERGVHSLMMTDKWGEIETAFLTYPIQNYFQENVNFKLADNMRSIYVPEINSYFLAATQKGSIRNDVVFCYNFALKEWYKIDENVSAFTKYVDRLDGNKTKVLVADDQGRVGKLDTDKTGRTVTWFDEKVTTQFTTGIIFPLTVTTEVNFSKITLYFKPQTIGSEVFVSYLVDGRFVEDLSFNMEPDTTGSLIGSAIIGVDKIGGLGTVKQVTRNIKGLGHSIELVFTHIPKTAEEDFELYGFVIEYEYGGEIEFTKTQ